MLIVLINTSTSAQNRYSNPARDAAATVAAAAAAAVDAVAGADGTAEASSVSPVCAFLRVHFLFIFGLRFCLLLCCLVPSILDESLEHLSLHLWLLPSPFACFRT